MFGSSLRTSPISIGNESFDKFLGGGFLNSSLNIFERQGPSSRLLRAIWNKSLTTSTLVKKNGLIYVNFNTSYEISSTELRKSLPAARKVKCQMLYKDIRAKSVPTKIKIAWRYSEPEVSSPSDGVARMEQIDFGTPLLNEHTAENLGKVEIMNVHDGDSPAQILSQLNQKVIDLKKSFSTVNIVTESIMHPFSPLVDNVNLCNFVFGLRCLSRILDKGAILISYDCDMIENYNEIQQRLYNLADCVVSFYSYETGENKLTGYKDIDGTLNYVKVPKIASYGFHFQRDISDWGYRLTKNQRFFMIDELSLPPCDDDDEARGQQTATGLTNIESVRRPLEQVTPLEEFREVAEKVLSKRL